MQGLNLIIEFTQKSQISPSPKKRVYSQLITLKTNEKLSFKINIRNAHFGVYPKLDIKSSKPTEVIVTM
jgi:hypothetical protein